jgi:quercetin dioxygenase-like cupin family protein
MKTCKVKEQCFGLTFIATGKDTNGAYFLSETIVPAGDPGPPSHFHSFEDESFFLQSGQLTFIIDRKEHLLKEGDFISIEKGETHTWKNDLYTDAKLLIIFSPAGIENMFRALEGDMFSMKEIGKKYGTHFF